MAIKRKDITSDRFNGGANLTDRDGLAKDLQDRDADLLAAETVASAALPKAGGTMTGAIAMGGSKITGLGTPTASGDAATKGYTDSVAVGLQWDSPVDVINYLGTRTIAQIDALSPAKGDAVVAGDAGTPAAGTSDAAAAGDVMEYDGTQWQKIVAHSGGFPPAGTRALVSNGTLFAPLTDVTDRNKVAEWDGASLTPTVAAAGDGTAVLVKGETGVNENIALVRDASGTAWVQFGGAGMDHGALTGLGDDDHTIYTKADGSRAFTGDQSMGGNQLTNVGLPVDAGDAAPKSYVDGVLQTVAAMNYLGTRTVAQIDALSPAAGDTVVAGDAGTPAAGTSDALAAGDTSEYDGTQWKKIVAHSGGFPPAGTKLVVSNGTLFAPLTDVTDRNKVAAFDGTSLTPVAVVAPADGSAVVVKGEGSVRENTTWLRDTSGTYVDLLTLARLAALFGVTAATAVSAGAGAGDAGKLIKLNGSGLIANDFLSPWAQVSSPMVTPGVPTQAEIVTAAAALFGDAGAAADHDQEWFLFKDSGSTRTVLVWSDSANWHFAGTIGA